MENFRENDRTIRRRRGGEGWGGWDEIKKKAGGFLEKNAT